MPPASPDVPFRHRVRKDIDIIFHDAQALTRLTPRLNPVAEGVTTHYQEQANALKLTLSDGDIDFIVAAPTLPNAPRESISVAGREIVLDATSGAPHAKDLASRLIRDILAVDRPKVERR